MTPETTQSYFFWFYLPTTSQVAQWQKNVPAKETQPNNANLQWDTADSGLIPGLRRTPGGGNRNLLQCSCLGNPMDKRWATVHRVSKSQTKSSYPYTHTSSSHILNVFTMNVIWAIEYSNLIDLQIISQSVHTF